MCHSLVNPKFLVQWTHRLLLNVNSFWGLYTCVFWYIYKLWEQTFCPACVTVCVRSLWIIRVFIVHVSIDCQTVRLSLEKWTLKFSELTNAKVNVYLWSKYTCWYRQLKFFLEFFEKWKLKNLVHSESYIVTVCLN